ncbi:MAG: NYN domain-containing protein [Pseudomonadota bacterium]
MPQARLAVLIDADNAQADLIAALLAEIAKLGVAHVKRIYGDWTKPHLAGWKEKLNEHAIQPMQQFAYTTGKNSTDSALIIDAMDLLYAGKFDGFCLVSSDSDFTRLAARLRESGMVVYGFGEKKTPRAMIAACDRFLYVEVLREALPAKAGVVAATTKKSKVDVNLLSLLRRAFDATADDSGHAQLSAMGSQISKLAPDFDSRNYGCKRLSDLVKQVDFYAVEERKGSDGKAVSHYVRINRV